MARGRKPQFSLNDLLGFLRQYDQKRSGTPSKGSGRLSPMSGAAEGVSGAGVRGLERVGRGMESAAIGAAEFASPWTAAERQRFSDSGLDAGLLASLALYLGGGAAVNRAGRGVRAARGALRGTRELFRENQVPASQQYRPSGTYFSSNADILGR